MDELPVFLPENNIMDFFCGRKKNVFHVRPSLLSGRLELKYVVDEGEVRDGSRVLFILGDVIHPFFIPVLFD